MVSILTHSIIVGVRSIFDEAIKLCNDNDEENKYLMTFQNLLSQIPQWNPNIIETERKRIELSSGCKYLEELITCVHIIQLKALTCVRVGQKQKKIDIDMPSIDKFIHQIYINCARKLYTNIYLFEKNVYPLQLQKNNRELEILTKESILLTIRDNIPVEQILRVYMEETEEQEINEGIGNNLSKEETQDLSNNKIAEVSKWPSEDPISTISKIPLVENAVEKKDSDNLETKEKLEKITVLKSLMEETTTKTPANNNNNDDNKKMEINFSNIDNTLDTQGKTEAVVAPKDLETLKNKAAASSFNKDNDDEDKLQIGDDIQLELDTITL